MVAAGLTYLLDQLSKVWALRVLPGNTINLVSDWLALRLSHNPGAALSMGTSITWVFTILAVAVSVGVAVLAPRLVSRTWAFALGLLVGGALGNLTDRLVRPPGPGRGAVVDFISYGSWFIGNVADIAIVSAMVLMMIGALRGVPLTATSAVFERAGGDQSSVAEPAGQEPAPGGVVSPDDGAAESGPGDLVLEEFAPRDGAAESGPGDLVLEAFAPDDGAAAPTDELVDRASGGTGLAAGELASQADGLAAALAANPQTLEDEVAAALARAKGPV